MYTAICTLPFLAGMEGDTQAVQMYLDTPIINLRLDAPIAHTSY